MAPGHILQGDLWRLEGRMTAFRRPGSAAGRRGKTLFQVPSGKQVEAFSRPHSPSAPHLWLNAADMDLKSSGHWDA